MLDQPVDNSIDVGRVLAGNHEATNFSVGDGLEIPVGKKTRYQPHKHMTRIKGKDYMN